MDKAGGAGVDGFRAHAIFLTRGNPRACSSTHKKTKKLCTHTHAQSHKFRFDNQLHHVKYLVIILLI